MVIRVYTTNFKCIALILLLFAVFSNKNNELFADTCELFIAENGNDSWSGYLPIANDLQSDGPLHSIEGAKRKVRKLKSSESCSSGITVNIQSGYYELENTFELTSIDSGRRDAPIVYRGYGPGRVILTGGRRLQQTRNLRGDIVVVDTKEQGFKERNIKQLFYNGIRQTIARWPNKRPSDFRDGEWAFVKAVDDMDNRKKFKYPGNRPAGWKNPENCQLSIYPNFNWWHVVAQVKAFDSKNRMVTLKENLPYPIKSGRRFFFQNVFEEIDTAEEWFYDFDKKLLYFWPPGDFNDSIVIAPILDTVINLNNVNYVALENLTIEGSNEDAVKIINGRHNAIEGCTIRNTGGVGVIISGGSNNGVRSSDIYDTGRGAVIISGGDRRKLLPGNNYADNNHIYLYGQLYKSLINGVTVKGVGNRITHNLVHDGPDIAIRIYGNNHEIEYNEIFDVCLNLSDTGAIYIGRDWTQRGNLIRFNKIHDVYGFGINNAKSKDNLNYQYETPFQAWGIYLDDCTSGTHIYGNILYRVPLGGIIVGGGRDNIIENNIFSDCIPAVYMGARSTGLFRRLEPILKRRLNDMNFKKPPYSSTYPDLLSLASGDLRKPINNRFIRNIAIYSEDNYMGLSSMEFKKRSAAVYYLNGFDRKTTRFEDNLIWHHGITVRILSSFYPSTKAEIMNWQEWRKTGFGDGSSILNPLFEDIQKDNFELKSASPAKNKGFVPIPISKIGLYLSEGRHDLPAVKETHRRERRQKIYKINLLQDD